MRLLCFHARRFRWKTCSTSLPGLPERDEEREVRDAVVAFVHAGAEDAADRAGVLRKAAKHLKWLARKGELDRVVLHSFTNLGSAGGDPDFAREWMAELAERLAGAGYAVETTPFGYQCEWDLAVGGDSLAKVWKEL